jgi:hypothetical protein
VNAYILMPWGMVEVKNVSHADFGSSGFANIRKANSVDYSAHVDAAKFPVIFAEEAPLITKPPPPATPAE